MNEDRQKQLEKELKTYFSGEQRRIACMSRLLISLVTICSVSYSCLAIVLNPAVQTSSNFKRIQRFFKEYSFQNTQYINFVFWFLSRMGVTDKIILAVDRTNWKFGTVNINILMVAVVYNGTAIPLIWTLLDKRGNSSQKERISLFTDLKKLLSVDRWLSIRCVVMDREFEGRKWLSYLSKEGLKYVLRVKKSVLVKTAAKSIKIWQLFECTRYKVLRKKRQVFGLKLHLSGQRIISKNGKLDYVIFVSNMSGAKVATYYSERWAIEVLFGDLKSRGFNFEDTQVTNIERIKTMIFLLAIAYIWAIKVGEWMVEKGVKIPLKKLNGRLRKLFSIFRVGLDHLRVKLIHSIDISDLITLLSCT